MNSGADELSEFRDALKAGDAIRLTALLQQADGPLPRGSRDETLLHSATSYLWTENRLALMTVLLDVGLKVDAMDHHGLTPLHWAAGYGCAECVQLLLRRGANVNAQRNDGRTPLHNASLEAIDQLIAAGADLHARDKDGCLPLHTSMLSDPRLLVEGVDARDRYGLTALHHAALQPNDEKVAWLLANGADPAAQLTAAFRINEDRSDSFEDPMHEFVVGTRPYDMARFRHDQVKWSTGKYRGILETLDAVTPRRSWFSR